MPRLVLEGVTKVFEAPEREPVLAVFGLTLEIEHKECMAIVGPSGSGKTTLLRLMAGLDELTSGTISIDGRTINGVAPKNRDVAMVFQSPALYPHLSAYENMAFGLRLRGAPDQEVAKRVGEVAEMLSLNNCLASTPMTLSGGQRQRVAIGRALVRRAKVLLLDEPLVNVDPTLRTQLRNEISSLPRELGMTVIYVTHDHLEALILGDRVTVLREGTLQQVADPRSLYARPANLFIAGFIGAPPMNLIEGAAVTNGMKLFFEATDVGQPDRKDGLKLELPQKLFERLAPHRKVVLGLRPEQIVLSSDDCPSSGCVIQGKIISLETSGPDTYVHAVSGGTSLVVRVPSRLRMESGQDRTFIADLEQACFFDTVSGKAVV